MPNRDGTGPRNQSPRPSIRQGGLGRGGCSPPRNRGRGQRAPVRRGRNR